MTGESDRGLTCPTCKSTNVGGISDGDSVGYWSCMDCKHEWPRGGAYAEQARRNIDRWRREDEAKR